MDPYRFLEHPDSNQTKAWISAQQELTDKFFNESKITKKIANKMQELKGTEAISLPTEIGEYHYFDYAPKGNDHSEEIPKYYRTKDANYLQNNKGGNLARGAEVVYDPNKELDVKKQLVSTEKAVFSDDGAYWAYTITTSGSDWETIKIRDMKTLKDFNETLLWSKFSGMEWSHDSKGFFYSKFDEPKDETSDKAGSGTQKLEGAKLMYHRVGTPQSKDVLIYKNDD